jgi:hypothetical protein
VLGFGDAGANADGNADAAADSAADSAQDALDDGFDACSLDPCGCRYPGPVTMTTHAIAICPAGMSTQLDAGFDADCIAGDAGANIFPIDCSLLCGSGASQCPILQDDAGFVLTCVTGCVGRLPDGYELTRVSADNAVKRWLAEVAQLEAASVHAFEILARELAAHGAPARLVRLARRAAADEVRHARSMRKLAIGTAAAAPAPSVFAGRVRSLEKVAIENAVEGCVRETFGALLATWQARAAGNARFRRTMARIARDETRHAELAWKVARWAEPRLGRAGRRRASAARRHAFDTLENHLSRAPDPDLVRDLGLPPPAKALTMARGLRAYLVDEL